MKAVSLSLSELNQSIRESVSRSFPENFWVAAEISEISTNTTGHCYLELIEKDPAGEKIVARMRATIWSSTYRMIRPYFERTTGYRLSAGIKILVHAGLSFHEIYGLSLNIKDIDPTYTLGDMARKKIEILNRLTSEGVIDMNRQLDFPYVPQRIAVISSETAAGYGDFMNTLMNNNYGFSFTVKLFPAIMQGDKSALSVIFALEKIFEEEEHFDVVALIRGGGAQADLDCFNNYDLAFNITQFPLPVLTGIGHERDETIADLVASRRLKTPTAVAEFIIDRMAGFLEYLQNCEKRVADTCRETLNMEKQRLTDLTRDLAFMVNRRLTEDRAYLSGITRHASSSVRQYIGKNRILLSQMSRLTFLYSRNLIERQKSEIRYRMKEIIRTTLAFQISQSEKLGRFERQNHFLDPRQILKRGFSITLKDGRIMRDAGQLAEQDEITTILFSGSLKSNVKQVIKKDENGEKRS